MFTGQTEAGKISAGKLAGRGGGHLVETVSGGRVVLREWFRTKTGLGAYAGLLYSESYSYSGNLLLSTTFTVFLPDGSIGSRIRESYFSGGPTSNVVETEVLA